MISRNQTESKRAIVLSGGSCIICGWRGTNYKGDSLLIGAHVRSYESAPEFDKADNIIALCPNHHAEYDGYSFTIDTKTKRIIHIDTNNPYHGRCVADRVKHIKEKYLAYEQYQFNKANNL